MRRPTDVGAKRAVLRDVAFVLVPRFHSERTRAAVGSGLVGGAFASPSAALSGGSVTRIVVVTVLAMLSGYCFLHFVLQLVPRLSDPSSVPRWLLFLLSGISGGLMFSLMSGRLRPLLIPVSVALVIGGVAAGYYLMIRPAKET